MATHGAVSLAPVEGPVTPRRFVLLRDVDVTGVSGVGVVAEGIQYTDESIALRWRGGWPMTAIWPSLNGVLAVHGHVGATQVRWLDPEPPRAERTPSEPGGYPDGRASGEPGSGTSDAGPWGSAWDMHDDPHPPPAEP